MAGCKSWPTKRNVLGHLAMPGGLKERIVLINEQASYIPASAVTAHEGDAVAADDSQGERAIAGTPSRPGDGSRRAW